MRHTINTEFKGIVNALIHDPFVKDEAGVKALKAVLDLPADKRNTELTKYLNTAFGDIHNFLVSGRVPEHIKSLTVTGAPTHARIAAFANMADESQIDMEWMQAFQIANVGPSFTKGEVVDYTNIITWDELKYGEEPKFRPLGKEAFAELEEKVFGAGFQLLTRWIETNNIYNINTGFASLRASWMTKKSDFAYNLLAATAGLPANITAASNSLDHRITALNAAHTALLRANVNKGYGLSARTPVLAYFADEHSAIIAQILNRQSGSETNNLLLKFPLIPVPTLNDAITTTIGTTTTGIVLVLPGRKNIWMATKGFRSAEITNVKSETIEVVAFDNWNAQAPAGQRQIVDLL